MSSPPIPSPSPDIAGAAARVGCYVWLSARLFEITGTWAKSVSEPRTKQLFLSVSGRFAWQASEWHRRLPQLAEVDRELLVRSPGEAAERRMDTLAGRSPAAERCAALADVVADLDAVYRAHTEVVQPVRDEPIARTLHRIRADLGYVQSDVVAGMAGDSDQMTEPARTTEVAGQPGIDLLT